MNSREQKQNFLWKQPTKKGKSTEDISREWRVEIQLRIAALRGFTEDAVDPMLAPQGSWCSPIRKSPGTPTVIYSMVATTRSILAFAFLSSWPFVRWWKAKQEEAKKQKIKENDGQLCNLANIIFLMVPTCDMDTFILATLELERSAWAFRLEQLRRFHDDTRGAQIWWAKKNWGQNRWTQWKSPEPLLWYWLPMVKCTPTNCSFMVNLFVTVQFLEETPAVLSLRRLCEDYGYSCEWVSGPKPRLAKDRKSIICKTYNFVPLVVRLDKKRDGKSNQATGDLLQVHLQVQSVSEQSDGQETGAILRKNKTKI